MNRFVDIAAGSWHVNGLLTSANRPSLHDRRNAVPGAVESLHAGRSTGQNS